MLNVTFSIQNQNYYNDEANLYLFKIDNKISETTNKTAKFARQYRK